MSAGVNRFYDSLEDAANASDRDLVGLFVYHLTVEMGEQGVTSRQVDECFQLCSLTPPRRTAAYLSEGVGNKEFVKASRGYQLHRRYKDELTVKLGINKAVVQTSVELRKLEVKISLGNEKSFLSETIDCFEAGANRATIIMCWILALDHLLDYVMAHKLTEFNNALSQSTDKGIKISVIKDRDDFQEIKENKLIGLLRAANIVSGDVKRILDEKLGVRNSCAHPSGLVVKSSKVVEFVDDLIENVVLKYEI